MYDDVRAVEFRLSRPLGSMVKIRSAGTRTASYVSYNKRVVWV
jgi:hypothetical protein